MLPPPLYSDRRWTQKLGVEGETGRGASSPLFWGGWGVGALPVLPFRCCCSNSRRLRLDAATRSRPTGSRNNGRHPPATPFFAYPPATPEKSDSGYFWVGGETKSQRVRGISPKVRDWVDFQLATTEGYYFLLPFVLYFLIGAR